MPGITISAAYGAGGSVIAAAVAQRLGLPLLDRAISSTVAARLSVSVEEAQGGAPSRSRANRFFSLLRPLSGGLLGAGTDAAPGDFVFPDEAESFREQAETVMREALPGGAVILGRAGSAALRDEPDVLRVRLFGSAAARARQAAEVEDVDEATAKARLPVVDNARRQYVKRLYHVDIDDPELYLLQIDSTKLPLETSAAIIADAYQGFLSAR